jgi:hypothetical protein
MKSVNMKLAGLVLLALSIVNKSFAQGVSDKKTQAGLTTTVGLNMLKMGTSKMQANGVGSDLGIGVMIHTGLKSSKNLGISYGLEFEFGSFKFKPANGNAVYYNYNDTEILSSKDTAISKGIFMLASRKQNPVYLTIPLMFLFRTDFIGDFRYFGKFGVKNSFLISSKINDKGNDLLKSPLEIVEFSNMKSPGETFFYNGMIGMNLGAEWNFIGSTCLVAEAGYFYGITPLFLDRKADKESLFLVDGTSFSNSANLNQILLKVSILF